MIILTGGAGFIGSCFLRKLNDKGISDIIVVDHLDNSDKWKNLVGKKFKDYVDKDDFIDLAGSGRMNKPDYVIHMGACSSTTLTDASYYMRNNYEYSKALAGWAIQSKAPFLYASSAATYGGGEAGYSDKPDNIYNLNPLNMYGYSKHLFDLWVLENNIINKVAGVKFFNVFGPNEYHKGDMMSVICRAFKSVKENNLIKLFKSYRADYKDGEQKRDFIYVKDAVEVMYYFFTNPKRTGIFNLGTGKARSWNDIANSMFLALGKKTNIEYTDMPDYLRAKYQYFTEADLSSLRSAGCSYQFTSLEESVKDYITGYLSKDGYL